ncbi:sugar ABC transporter ATP-binding protein [Limnochorda pilosa]|uniref:D-ribose transporter ATP binding protein n=1 Tax=Limnochorda pilosa TaxID=1555112 RepID=A0A0K2SLT3_LIMPI|nr:sugar ABC transporter ATP-binding protein [Limnochorda pilosa]BAS28078.1 D-ribose transporter ATP binding protein [Limnochorda pilosa]
MDRPILELRRITKRFPGVLALSDVSFDLHPGEVHCIVGENGAGKSTLIKVMSGIHLPDEGEIRIDGRSVVLDSPRRARESGVATIHQELQYVPGLSIAENLFLGREYTTRWRTIDWTRMWREAGAVLQQVGLTHSPRTPMAALSIAHKQLVEIARAVAMNGRVLIMDEPTSSLTAAEIEELYRIIESMRQAGVGVVFISHRLEDVRRIADRVTVLRDGRRVVTVEDGRSVRSDDLIRWMAGETLPLSRTAAGRRIGQAVLRVENVTRRGLVHDVSFTLKRGEILGFAGLVGSGRTELMRSIFGADPMDSGRIELDNRTLRLRGAWDAVRHGIGFLPEDRKGQGLMLDLPVRFNVTLAGLRQLAKSGRIDLQRERRIVDRFVGELRIKTPGVEWPVRYLSGGNQQKVVIARWLLTESRVLIFDEPTRGVDVAGKAEIHRWILRLAEQGLGIIVVSSEIPELLDICDRILVMRDGRIAGELKGQNATKEDILRLQMGEEGYVG